MTSRGGGVDDAASAENDSGWQRRVTMVVVVMAPGLCWDNELGGRSLVSAIVSPAIDHGNNDLLNQQSTNNGGKRRGGGGGEEEGGVGVGGGGGEEEEDFNNASRRRS